MNKKTLFLSILVCAHIHAQTIQDNTTYNSLITIPTRIYEKISKPLINPLSQLEAKFINGNKVLKVITWSSLGTLFGYLSYRTMYNIYHKNQNPDPNPILGDKIMLTIMCYICAAENALELYKSYR